MRRAVAALVLTLPLLPAAARAEAPAAEEPPDWAAALYVDAYFLPGESGYVVPTIFVDRGPLHLEVRYNYEDFDTVSLWGGWGFTFGDERRYAKVTPMLGAVAGSVSGLAPGLEIDARWGRLTYWLESEYLFDLKDSSGNSLYAWSELHYAFVPWLWAGGSLQRFKAAGSPNEVDVGPMIGAGKPGARGWSLSLYAYALTRSTPTWLVTGALLF